jgi:replication factor A1
MNNFRWTIKARVSNKGQIRTYENARGPGKLFSCDFVDQSGDIRATGFNAECDKFYSMLEIGEVCFSMINVFKKKIDLSFRFIILLKHR